MTDRQSVAAGPTRFRVGEWRVDATLNTFENDSGRSRVPPRLVDLLVRLARHPGTVIDRDTLLSDVWTGQCVNDEVISRAVAELRSALGDSARKPRYIETVPKRGYRLIAPLIDDPDRSNGPGAWHKIVFVAGVLALVLSLAWMIPMAMRSAQRSSDAAMPENPLASPRQLTFEEHHAHLPTLSPDGQRVVYVREETLDTHLVSNTRTALWMVSAADLSRRRLTDGEAIDTYPSFSPDGQSIAFAHQSDGHCVISIMNLELATSNRIAECDRLIGGLDWSPNGRSLVAAFGDNELSLYQIVVATGEVTPLTQRQPHDRFDFHPRYDPDGANVTFIRGRRLHSIPSEGGEPRALAEHYVFDHAWSPVSGDLVLVSSDSGRGSLVWLDPQSGDSRDLGINGVKSPRFSVSGALVYETTQYRADIHSIPVQPGVQPRAIGETALVESVSFDNSPAISPDQQWLAFASNRSGLDAIWIQPLQRDAPARLLLELEDTRLFWPSWSADGETLMVTARRRDQSLLYRIDLATGSYLPISAAGTQAESGQWGPGGEIYFIDRADERHQLMRLQDESARPLGPQGVTRIFVAGDRVLYSQVGVDGVSQWRPDESIKLTELPISRYFEYWAAAGDRLVTADVSAGQVFLTDLVNRTTTATEIPGTYAPGGAYALSPDGATILVSYIVESSSDIMLVSQPRL